MFGRGLLRGFVCVGLSWYESGGRCLQLSRDLISSVVQLSRELKCVCCVCVVYLFKFNLTTEITQKTKKKNKVYIKNKVNLKFHYSSLYIRSKFIVKKQKQRKIKMSI